MPRDAAAEENRRWTPEVFVTAEGTAPFTKFVEGLDDFTFGALDAAIRHVLVVRGIDLVRTEWLKPLGKGLHEFRVRHDEAEIAQMFGGADADDAVNAISPPRAILLRVFVHFYGDKVILLLSGYDKGHDPSDRRQQREVAEARRYLTAWSEQQLRKKAGTGRQRGAGSGSSRRKR